LYYAPRLVQEHLTLDDFAEEELPGLGADGDEIHATSGVIISAQTDGPAMM
jgi:hypothetical protein